MLNQILRLTSPPVFDNEDQTRMARPLYIIMLAALVGAVIYAIFAMAFHIQGTNPLIAIVGILLLLALLALTRRGTVKLAGILFILGAWVLVTWGAYAAGGVFSPAFDGYIVIVVAATLLFSRRIGLLTILLSLLSGAGFVYVQNQNLLPAYAHVPLATYLIHGVVFVTTGLMLIFFNNALKTALQSLQQNAVKLDRANQNLCKCEEQYRLIAENAEDLIWAATMDLQLTYASPSLARALGYSIDELLAVSPDRFITAESSDTGLKTLREEVNQTSPQADPDYARLLELEYRRKDSSTFWAEMKFSFFRDEAGRPVGILGVGRDITEQKRSERSLQAAEAQYRSLVERLPAVVYTSELGVHGKWTYVSPQIKKLLDFTPEEWMSDPDLWYRQVHPDDRERQEKLEEQAWVRNEPFDSEYRIFTRQNREIWVRDVAQILPGQNGGAPIVQGTLMDVTERRQSEERLHRQEQILRLFVEHSPVAVAMFDREMRYMVASRRYLIDYELDEQDLTGRSQYEVFPNTPERWQEIHRRCLMGATERSEAELLPHTNKKSDWVRWEIRPWFESTGEIGGIIQSSEIITERIEAQAALKESRERLQLFFNQSLDGFFFGMLDEPVEWNDSVDKEKVLEYVLEHQRVTEANDAMIQQYGASREDFLGRTVIDFYTHDLEQARTVRQQLFDAGHINIETEERRDDGSTLWVQGDYVCMYDEQKHITGMFGIQRDITERKLTEQHAKIQFERLASLRAIDMAIASSTDLNLIFYILLTQAMTRLKVDAADILLYEQVTNSFKPSGLQGFRTPDIQRAQIHMGEGLAGRAALERTILHKHNITKRDFPSIAPYVLEEGFTCCYAVPLMTKGKITGVMEIFEREHHTHDHDWIEFLDSLAGQAAIAIENSNLFSNLQRSNNDLRNAYEATIEGWSRALDLRDKETEGHTQRVTGLTERLAEFMGIEGEQRVNIRRGALLHDIGKMGVPDKILLKPGPLTDEEWAIMRKHPEFALNLLSPIAYLKNAMDIPYCHHEKWDGTGYPRKLKGNQIPLPARIFAIVDVYDALTSDRPYRIGWLKEKAMNYIREQAGAHFDPNIVDLFLEEMKRVGE